MMTGQQELVTSLLESSSSSLLSRQERQAERLYQERGGNINNNKIPLFLLFLLKTKQIFENMRAIMLSQVAWEGLDCNLGGNVAKALKPCSIIFLFQFARYSLPIQSSDLFKT